jgi:hypothetical protein
MAEPVGVIASVAEHRLGVSKSVEHQDRTFVIAHLRFAEEHGQRSSRAIAHGVQLGVQTAFRAPDTSGNSSLLSRLAAVR